MRTLAWIILPVLLLAVLGCHGGGRRRRSDGGTVAADTGGVPIDGGTAGRDADFPPLGDAGDGAGDAGDDPLDAGDELLDAGGDPVDAGTYDAGRDAGRDAGGAPGADAGVGDCIALGAGSPTVRLGELDASDTSWTRPEVGDGCPGTVFSTHTTRYDAYCFYNPSSSEALIDIDLEGSEDPTLTQPDPYLVVYGGASLPADPLLCLDANDDAGETYDSLVASLSVAPGARITVIATGFNSAALGTYRLTLAPAAPPPPP